MAIQGGQIAGWIREPRRVFGILLGRYDPRWGLIARVGVLGLSVLLTACTGPSSATGGDYGAASPTAAPPAAAAAAPTAVPAAPPAPAPAPKAYVGDFQDNTVTVLDSRTNQVLTTIPVPAGPHGMIVTPDGRKVFVSSDGASTISVIDTTTDRVSDSIEVGKAPHGLALTPDGRQLLATVFDASQVVFIDAATDQVTGQVPVPNPHNVAISRDGRLA